MSAHPNTVAALLPNTRYLARIFNPVSGKITELGSLTRGAPSDWTANALVQSDGEDWVLLIEREG